MNKTELADQENNPALLHDTQTKLAPMYAVLMHNDPFTTMEFVMDTLVGQFSYDNQQAFETMYLIHTTGLQRIAILPLEHAETRVVRVHQLARSNGYPLTCTIEKEDV